MVKLIMSIHRKFEARHNHQHSCVPTIIAAFIIFLQRAMAQSISLPSLGFFSFAKGLHPFFSYL